MTAPIHDDELVELALGTMPAAYCDALAREVGEARLDAEAAEAAEALTALAVALPPVQPSPGLRDRLLASARARRHAPFVDRLARLIDVAAERAQELLASLARPEVWVGSQAPNIHLVHLEGGPATAGADVGFVRVAAGTAFPPHRHLGEETALVLQGCYDDSSGEHVRAGDLVHLPAGSSHSFVAGAEEDLIYVVVFGGIEIEGLPPG
jgi:quercetin dioxygenase-like cupin family protein